MKITDIVYKVDCSRGAQMGRGQVGSEPMTVISGRSGRIFKKNQVKVYDKRVPMSNCGAYDIGGVYWGLGGELRVRFTKDLSFVQYYRA